SLRSASLTAMRKGVIVSMLNSVRWSRACGGPLPACVSSAKAKGSVTGTFLAERQGQPGLFRLFLDHEGAQRRRIGRQFRVAGLGAADGELGGDDVGGLRIVELAGIVERHLGFDVGIQRLQAAAGPLGEEGAAGDGRRWR